MISSRAHTIPGRSGTHRRPLSLALLSLVVLALFAIVPPPSPDPVGAHEGSPAAFATTGLKAPRRLSERKRIRKEHKAALRRNGWPDEAALYWYEARKDSRGEVPMERLLEGRLHLGRLRGGKSGRPLPSLLDRSFGTAAGPLAAGVRPGVGGWTSIGPTNIGGRTRAILVRPGGLLYAAGVSGGIFKSTDYGASWVPLTDFMATLSVSTLALDPLDSNRIYAGTGEGLYEASTWRGAGIFVTTDGGATWSRLPATTTRDFHFVNKLAVSPTDSRRLYAATLTGVFRSVDQGATWTTRTTGDFRDLVVYPNGSVDNVLVWRYRDTVFRSLDGGDSFSAAGTGIATAPPRGAFAVKGPTLAYCVVCASDEAFGQLYRTTDNATSWTPVTDVGNTGQGRLNRLLFSNTYFALDRTGSGVCDCTRKAPRWLSQGIFDMAIAIDPADSNRIWVGGIDTWRSDDGGVTFGLAANWALSPPETPPGHPNYVHADVHAFVFDPAYDGTTNARLYVGCDGGVYRTDTARGTIATDASSPYFACTSGTFPGIRWTPRNTGYCVTQFYRGAVSPDGSVVIGGTQDNGTLQLVTTSTRFEWNQVLGGDGGYCAIDPRDPKVIYGENPSRAFAKSIDGGRTFREAVNGITEPASNFDFVTPFAMDPSNPDRLWIAGRQIFRTTDATALWGAVSVANLLPSTATAIAVAPSGGGRIVYVGTGRGELFRSADALVPSPTWTNIRSNLPVAHLSSIAVAPDDPNRVWATFSSFSTTGGQLWFTPDASRGAATQWSSRIGTPPDSIPDIPVHTVALSPQDPNLVFVGTDLGALASADSGATWCNVNGSTMANAMVSDLVFRGQDQLYAFTHGRGVYRAAINSPLLSVTAPAPSVRVVPGSNATVTWSLDTANSLASRVASLDVAVSTDGGTTFADLATGLAASARSTVWAVPSTLRTLHARLRVTARDAALATLGRASSTGDVIVNGNLTCDAGPGATVQGGSRVTLTGQGSDTDGDPISYTWEQVSGTPVAFTPGAPSITFNAPASPFGQGLEFSLSVSDGLETTSDKVTVMVTGASAGSGSSNGCRAGAPSPGGPIDLTGDLWLLLLAMLAGGAMRGGGATSRRH